MTRSFFVATLMAIGIIISTCGMSLCRISVKPHPECNRRSLHADGWYAFPWTFTITFERTFGESDWDGAYSVAQTTDGGYIVAGETQSFGAGNYDVYLIKTDATGDEEWFQTFGGSYLDVANSVKQTTDDGYIIAGDTQSFGAGYTDVYLIKIDAAGNEEWSQTFGGSDWDGAFSVDQTNDGGYIIAGWTDSFGVGFDDVYLIKTDAVGNEEWSQTFGGSDFDGAYSVTQTIDGGYIVAGRTYSFGAGGGDVYLIKTDSAGNEEWERTFGGSGWDRAHSVQQIADGDYIVAGWTFSFGAGSGDVYLIKTDADGNEEWFQTFGGSSIDYGYSVDQTTDGGYIIAGDTYSFGTGGEDVYLIKTDAEGNEEWSQTFGGSNDDYSSSLEQTTDGGYIVAGGTQSFGAGSRDVYLIKTDSNGEL